MVRMRAHFARYPLALLWGDLLTEPGPGRDSTLSDRWNALAAKGDVSTACPSSVSKGWACGHESGHRPGKHFAFCAR